MGASLTRASCVGSDEDSESSSCEPVGCGWPASWPLPAPRWSPAPHAITFGSTAALTAFRAELDRLLADHLARHDYDGLDVVLRFHEAYARWQRAGAPGTFGQWRRQFVVSPEPEHLTCVGLSRDMLARLEKRGSPVASHFYVASAEEVSCGAEWQRRPTESA